MQRNLLAGMAGMVAGEGLRAAAAEYGPRLGRIAANVCKFRGPEHGSWGHPDALGRWHFHVGDGSGLDDHHLPYELSNWWQNLKAVVKRIWNE